MESTLKGKNLLLEEQILSSQSWLLLKSEAQSCFPFKYMYTHSSQYCLLEVYLTKKKLDGFYSSVISLVLRNPTYYRYLFIALMHLFSTQQSFQNPLYATKTVFFYDLYVHSNALVVLLANCYVDSVH